MWLPLQAMLFGFFSALSLPLGAMLGIAMSPISEKTTAAWMAVGSGALVFAVATQLYGESLFKLMLVSRDGCDNVCRQRFKNVNVQNLFGIIGALLYLGLNRWLARLALRKPPASEGSPPASVGVPLRSQSSSSDAREALTRTASGNTQTSDASPIAALAHWRRARTRSERALSEGISFSIRENEISTSRGVQQPAAREAAEAPAAVREEVDGHEGPNVALSMWLGLLLDGIPESLMLGFMTNEGAISMQFLAAVFLANFPEAFSGASLLKGQGMSLRRNLAMWSSVFLLTGFLAMIGSAIMPAQVQRGSVLDRVRDVTTAASEGLTGGAMLAMIATAMLPEAFKGAGELAGVLFVAGFVLSVFINGLGARFGDPQLA